MKDRPIIFSGKMVRAILDGRKTQTRRIVKPQPPAGEYKMLTLSDTTSREDRKRIGKHHWAKMEGLQIVDDQRVFFQCPYGQTGDYLWVREAWRSFDAGTHEHPVYRADVINPEDAQWKSPIHMPRHMSRVALKILAIRLERLQQITEADAEAEGFSGFHNADSDMDARDDFACAWTQMHGYGSWAANPWVWVVEFKRTMGAMNG